MDGVSLYIIVYMCSRLNYLSNHREDGIENKHTLAYGRRRAKKRRVVELEDNNDIEPSKSSSNFVNLQAQNRQQPWRRRRQR